MGTMGVQGSKVRWAAVLAATTLALSFNACNSRCRFVRTDQADFFMVRGEYAVIILHPDFAAKAFGRDWATQSLFYRTSRAITQDGQRSSIQAGNLRPIAKGELLLSCSGDDWEHQFFAVYSLERSHFVGLTVDFRKCTIEAQSPVKPLYDRTATVLPDGRLLLHD